MNTETNTDTVSTAQDLVAEGAAYKLANTPTEAELPDGVWLMATAMEISHITGITAQEAAEALARNEAQARASRAAGAWLFQIAGHAVGHPRSRIAA